jgi:exodeoxyribonuclease VII small subunit
MVGAPNFICFPASYSSTGVRLSQMAAVTILHPLRWAAFSRKSVALMKKTEKTNTFEASLTALEQVVRELERGDVPLEESLRLFEQGVKLSRECQERLGQAERRIEILLRDQAGRPNLVAFDEARGDDDTF